MLGCHDFCGYYDWTFHHVRSIYGQDAIRQFWADAIGAESQKHYADAAQAAGLRGLLNAWTKAGVDEQCDWTFTLDEERNVLRWDMRACPSKGFLLDHDLHVDEDYCDHCIGWIAPLLRAAGIEVAVHEHNHRGQCWAEMRVKRKVYLPPSVTCDIRADERWRQGHVDRFVDGKRLSDDSIAVLLDWFKAHPDGVIISDEDYCGEVESSRPRVVVLGDDQAILRNTAQRRDRGATVLLVHAYLPRQKPINSLALGPPVPILPALIRAGVYEHIPDAVPPSVRLQVALLTDAIARLREPQ
jgi:hypothetical protein